MKEALHSMFQCMASFVCCRKKEKKAIYIQCKSESVARSNSIKTKQRSTAMQIPLVSTI